MEDAYYRLDDFQLYNLAREFRKKMYRVANRLPEKERFELAMQMRDAARSVTNNIAEGHGRFHFQENIQFCRQSRGSVEELIDDLNICTDEGYASELDLKHLKEEGYFLVQKINGYIAYLTRKKRAQSREASS